MSHFGEGAREVLGEQAPSQGVAVPIRWLAAGLAGLAMAVHESLAQRIVVRYHLAGLGAGNHSHAATLDGAR